MSCNSLKQCGVSSQPRSISDIIESLRNSFQLSDYKAAVDELMAREEGLRWEKANTIASLREKSDFFEGERNELKLEKLQWEEESRRLRREFDVNDDQLKELTRELSLVKERELKANKKYDGLYKELTDMGVEKDEVIRNLADMTEMFEELKRDLREKEGVIDELTGEMECRRDARLEELMEARRKNEYLEEENRKFAARLEALRREEEESLEDMMKRNEVEKRKVEAQLKAQLEEVKELRIYDGQKDERIKKLLGEIELLEREKRDIVKEKDRKILQLEEEKGALDLEKRDLKTKYGQVEERFLKLEKDVISCLCLDLGRKKDFAGSQFGKILSKIILALDSEDFDCINAGLAKDGNLQEADPAFNSHANEPDCGVKSDEQPVEDVRRKLVFDCDDATENKMTTCANLIVIDSDGDENESTRRAIGVKRQHTGSLSEHQTYDGSGNDSSNPKVTTKKLKQVQCEQVKQKLSSATKYDHKLNSHQRQILPDINITEEKLKGEVTGPRSCSFSKDIDGKTNGSKNDCGIPKPDDINWRVEDLTNSFMRRKQNKCLECEADMVFAFDQDLDLCAKAICALYRHKKSCISSINDSTSLRRGQFQQCDLERMTALANYLTDGVPRGKMKKTIDELRKHDPRGLDDCIRLAKGYSKQLIDIYRKGEDPFFSPLSTDLQYT